MFAAHAEDAAAIARYYKAMQILIVGAGGTGGFFGAWLLKAKRNVTFLVRPARAQQLRERGLELQGPSGNLHIPSPQTILAADLNQSYDLILLSSKSYDLQSAIEDFAPAVGPGTSILPLLNGMAHMDILDQRFGRQHVLGGDTTISAVRDSAGRILHLNALDDLHFGDRDEANGDRIKRITEALTVPGYTAHRVDNILYAMWQKWIAISTAASITCLFRASIGDVMAAGAEPMIKAILAEITSIAGAEGYAPQPQYLDVVVARFTERGSLFTTSMSRDIEANAPIEAQQIIGDLLVHARARDLKTPMLDVVFAHLRCYEERRRRELATPGQ